MSKSGITILAVVILVFVGLIALGIVNTLERNAAKKAEQEAREQEQARIQWEMDAPIRAAQEAEQKKRDQEAAKRANLDRQFAAVAERNVVAQAQAAAPQTAPVARAPVQATPSLKVCQTCKGVGRYDKCIKCFGSREIPHIWIDARGERQVSFSSADGKVVKVPCDVCSGAGTRPCGDCNGRGTVP